MASNKLRVAILGASGYTGAELVRLLSRHPQVAIVALTADRQAGKPAAEVFPQLVLQELPTLTKIDDVDWSGVDFVFCCLPHGLTQEVIAKLPRHLKIVDLSADFRLADVEAYATWYGHAHHAPDLQKEAVYGLTEIKRDAVRTARLVANPGCYPTAAQLPLIPLLEKKLIDAGDIIIDAKSGVTGAGRDAKQGSLYSEVTEGIHAYGVASHRHAPEIEQGLGRSGRQADPGQFHPAPDADEPRHPRHHLREDDARRDRRPAARRAHRALSQGVFRARAAERQPRPRRATCAAATSC